MLLIIKRIAKTLGMANPGQYSRNVSSPERVFYTMGDERTLLTAYLEKANISGLMVLQDGEIKLEYYSKGLNRESRNHIWSASKSFTSTLVAMAHFEGKPDRNDMYWDIIQERQDFDAWAGALGRRVPAGTDFNYTATDTHVLSAVLRGACGQPFTEIMQDRLWLRGRFGGDATWGLDGSGHAMGHCCLSLRLEEFAHLGQLYVEDLVIKGAQTVRDDWFAMVENPQAPFQEPRVDEAGDLQHGYSVQFWIPHDYDQEFIAAGAFDQYLWIDRRQGAVVAQFSTGQPMLFTENGAGPAEFATVMRALARRETFQ